MEVKVVDMRSDTFTKPTKEMRVAMMEAEVGDDVMSEDPTVTLLQEKVAEELGKESALFVPSGTMANLICMMVHCSRRGNEVLIGDNSHISQYEQGGVASVGGVHPRTVRNLKDGTIDLDDVRAKVFRVDDHFPRSTLLCVENSHNLSGGRVLTLDYMKKVAALVKELDLKLHIDGARLFNAAVALGVPAAELVVHADSVSVCLSKGLGAPVGSVIAASRAFITEARRVRKALGGGMRQVGVLAAPGLIALQVMRKRLHEDHTNAQLLAEGLAAIAGLRADVTCVQTNIVLIHIQAPELSSTRLLELLADPGKSNVAVKLFSMNNTVVRAVLCYHVNQEDVKAAIVKFREVMKMFTQ